MHRDGGQMQSDGNSLHDPFSLSTAGNSFISFLGIMIENTGFVLTA